VSIDRVGYGDGRSYDILAASGLPYLANGVPMASTIAPLAAAGPARCDGPLR
jgi:hypothetical protein